MAAAKTSMPASASGLPCSDVKRGARSAVEASSTSATASSAARRAASSLFQSRAALAAASKAASSCCALHSGAWANTSPVAGFFTPNDSPTGTVSPPMVITLSVMADPFINHLWRTLAAILPERWARLNEVRSGEELVEESLYAEAHPTLQGAILG